MTSDSGGDCGGVVLAAGEARRFGSPKLHMPFGGSTVLGSVVRTLASAGIAPVVVVTRAEHEDLFPLPGGPQAEVVCNPTPDRGMVSSMQVGLNALPPRQARFLIALGDQPRISPDGISRLLQGHAISGKPIAIPVFDGKRGHPVVFDGAYRPLILAIAEGQTLRDLIEAHREDIVEVDCGSDAHILDIDTREDYEHELRRWLAGR